MQNDISVEHDLEKDVTVRVWTSLLDLKVGACTDDGMCLLFMLP
jgi:hypothetical protein